MANEAGGGNESRIGKGTKVTGKVVFGAKARIEGEVEGEIAERRFPWLEVDDPFVVLLPPHSIELKRSTKHNRSLTRVATLTVSMLCFRSP